jgi:hypothetical protein
MRNGVACTVFILGALASLLLPAFNTKTNCGGNSAALTYTKSIALAAAIYGREIAGESNVIQAEAMLDDFDFRSSCSFGWGVRSFWLKKEIDREEKEPTVICAQIFSNVPQPALRNFYAKNPGFAPAYSDGTTKILTPPEFNRIDLATYCLIQEVDLETANPGQ